MFRIGEHVMYRNIGICEVEAIGKSAFLWTKKKIITHCAPCAQRTIPGFMSLSVQVPL